MLLSSIVTTPSPAANAQAYVTSLLLQARDVIHDLHGKMFGLSEHELDLIHYCGIAFVKLCVFLFFLFPWLAIKLVTNKAAA